MANPAIVTPWHPLDNPECTNCHGLSKPVRPKKKAPDCGTVQLKLSRQAKLRRRLLQLVHDAQLPRDTLARIVLGVDTATMYRYLQGKRIEGKRAAQLQAIESIVRDGRFTVVVYDTGSESPRWSSMLRTRARKTPRPKKLSYTDETQSVSC